MNCYKVMLGKGSQLAAQAIQGGFIGVDDGVGQDLTPWLELPEPEFRDRVWPGLEMVSPNASRGTISQAVGDMVLSPTGTPGQLRVGEVIGLYHYAAGEPLPHRRAVQWSPAVIQRSDMSLPLQNSSGGITTIIDLTGYSQELALLAAGPVPDGLTALPPASDPGFQMERDLENFLVANWAQTELGAHYDLYPDEDGTLIGQQYQTVTGPIDILAVKKDRSELLVIELKRGRATDRVVGQVQRYMGYVKREVAEPGQKVRGLIIALEDDPKLQYALEVAPDISFYTYRVSFKLNHTGGQAL